MRISRAVAITLLLNLVIAGMMFAEDRGDEGDGRYLALGDSLAFGYITQAGFEYINPDNFVSFAAQRSPCRRRSRSPWTMRWS